MLDFLILNVLYGSRSFLFSVQSWKHKNIEVPVVTFSHQTNRHVEPGTFGNGGDRIRTVYQCLAFFSPTCSLSLLDGPGLEQKKTRENLVLEPKHAVSPRLD